MHCDQHRHISLFFPTLSVELLPFLKNDFEVSFIALMCCLTRESESTCMIPILMSFKTHDPAVRAKRVLFHGEWGCCGLVATTTRSTRRFILRPSGEELSATGRY